MSIDPLSDAVISLAEAARLLPARRRGKRPHLSCLYRWCTTGCRGVILESIQIGGTRCTSKEALRRFFERLSAAQSCPQAETSVQRQRRREREIEAADKQCAAAGI